jgi:hypothetical protein
LNNLARKDFTLPSFTWEKMTTVGAITNFDENIHYMISNTPKTAMTTPMTMETYLHALLSKKRAIP